MDLISKKWWFFVFSFLLITPGLISLGLYGLKLGIDFSGGTLLEYKQSLRPDGLKIEKEITKENLEAEFEKSQVEVSSIIASGNNTFIVKTKPLEEKVITEIKNRLSENYGNVEQLRVESVGAVIGAEATRNAFTALILSSVMIVIYIAYAFRKIPRPASSLRFGITAVAALLHDVLLLVGLFSILGHFLHVEIDILFVTALLTVIGFSVHDTIVVFDRIRENLPKHLSKNFSDVANISILQTLARSLNTSLTVVFVLLALLLFGGETIRWFVVALLVGIISGTYSSIFNATALLALWEEKLGH